MLNEQDGRDEYIANGSTAAFTYTFRILTKNDIEVLADSLVKIVDTDYTVTGIGDAGGGSVTFGTLPVNDTLITLLRKQPIKQPSDHLANQAWASRAEIVEQDLDKIVMTQQMHKESLARAIKLNKKSTKTEVALDDPGASQFVRWDSTGTKLEPADLPTLGTSAVETLTSYTKANLPTGGDAGDLARVTDDVRGVWMFDGTNWFALNKEIVSVKDFGALGDGSTEDSTAIQAAIDAKAATAVWFPPGTYIIDTVLALRADLRMFGTGAILKAKVNLNERVMQYTSVEGGAISNILIEDLEIDGNKANQSSGNADGIRIINVTNAVIRNCHAHDCWSHGIYVQDCSQSKITGNRSIDNSNATTTADGIYVHDCDHTVIANNFCKGNHRIGITLEGDGGGGTFGEWNTVENNICEDNNGMSANSAGIWIENSRFVTIGGNVCEGSPHAGILIAADATYCTITGNRTEGTGARAGSGIVITAGAGGISISGNTLRNHRYGIILTEDASARITGVAITGNHVSLCNENGIRIENGPGISCIGNIVENNGQNTGGFVDTSASRAGIYVRGTTGAPTEVIISGNICQDTQGTATQSFGIFREGANAARVQILDNIIRGNISALTGGTAVTEEVLANRLYATTVWDPASLADGASATTTITVTGAVVGSPVTVGLSTITNAEWQLTAYVTSGNTVTVTLTNHTGGTVDISSGTLYVNVFNVR